MDKKHGKYFFCYFGTNHAIFYFLPVLEFSEPYVTTIFYEERRKPDTLVVIDNYLYNRHTHIHTYKHGDFMTDPVKILLDRIW